MYTYQDAPMNIYSGTVKVVVKLSFRALKIDNKLERYLRILKISRKMELMESMNIPWFPLMNISNESFPRMVSENHIDVGSYLKVMGLNLKKLVTTPPMIFPPYSTKNHWNKNLTLNG